MNTPDKYPLIILSKDEAQYREIAAAIHPDPSQLVLYPYISREQDPYYILQLSIPGIVIVDESFLTDDAIKLMQKSLPSSFHCRFLILYSEETDPFRFSSQLGSSTAISKSNFSATIQFHLDRALEYLNWHIVRPNFVYEATRLYFNTVFLQSISATQSIESVNQSFGFTFHEGLFRIMIVKLDYDGNPRTIYGKLFPLQKRIEELLYTSFMNCCYEVILCRTFDGIIMTINFSKEDDPHVCALIDRIFPQIQSLCADYQSIVPTLCMGKIYDYIGGVCQSRIDAHTAVWGRMVLGANRILCTSDCSHLQFPLHLEARYQALRVKVCKAFDELDIPTFTQCMNEIFDASDYILGSHYMSDYLNDLTLSFFQIQEDAIAKFSNIETLKNKTVYILIMSPTIQKYKETFIMEFTDLMYRIILQENKNFSKNVQNAIAYIKEHYKETITLSDIAESIGINPSYLSSTFKAETGTGLSNYISFYRIQAACRLLRQTDKPIVKIAAEVNIEDNTYFAKQFKKYVGTTPTEYRKIFH